MDDRRKLKRYSPVITLGNILTILVIAGGVGGWMLTDHDSIISVKAEQTAISKELAARDVRDREFREGMHAAILSIQSDMRQMRENGAHIRWRELPPSAYQRGGR